VGLSRRGVKTKQRPLKGALFALSNLQQCELTERLWSCRWRRCCRQSGRTSNRFERTDRCRPEYHDADTNAGRQTLTNWTVANRSRVGEVAVAFEVLALQLADKREVAGTGERNFNATVNGCLLGVVAEVEVEAVVAQTEVTGDGCAIAGDAATKRLGADNVSMDILQQRTAVANTSSEAHTSRIGFTGQEILCADVNTGTVEILE
jgi:hypothetical protein